ncbi:MAG: DUF1207 domain-containing protein [Verrucomicrobia bacterium]|nr:DUF1207 domain-containing protein [Verrucomicrobiota bacterium]
MRRITLTVAVLLFGGLHQHAYTQEHQQNNEHIEAIELPEDFAFQAGKNDSYNAYLQAYLQGSFDAKFPSSGVVVTIRNGSMLLSNLPHDETLKKEIVAYANTTANASSILHTDHKEAKVSLQKSGYSGRWFPQSTILYPTQIANPLQVAFSGGLRFNGRSAGSVSTPVTFGDQFPLYRWSNLKIGDFIGDMQLEIEGAIFAIFNQSEYSSPLINADYYVALPLSYAYNRWAHRVRIYHISSHLGDEYMNRRHHAKRLNKSFEAIDLFTSYNLTDQIRLYGGVGVIAHSDSEMKLKPLYAEYGLEARVGRREWKELYGVPYLAMHFRNYQDRDYDIDATFALGYEVGKISGLGQKLRVSLEYHNGFCDEGQFSRKRSDYIQAKVAYGF